MNEMVAFPCAPGNKIVALARRSGRAFCSAELTSTDRGHLIAKKVNCDRICEHAHQKSPSRSTIWQRFQ